MCFPLYSLHWLLLVLIWSSFPFDPGPGAGRKRRQGQQEDTYRAPPHPARRAQWRGAIYLMLVVGNTRQTGALEQVRPCRTLLIYLFHEFLFIYSWAYLCYYSCLKFLLCLHDRSHEDCYSVSSSVLLDDNLPEWADDGFLEICRPIWFIIGTNTVSILACNVAVDSGVCICDLDFLFMRF